MTVADSKELRITVGERVGDVSALYRRPPDARALFVLAHGAGAGMRHAFMEAIADRLEARQIATLRYQFPYMEAGRRSPDVPGKLVGTVRAAVRKAAELAPDIPLFAGGKSLGGRMTSTAAASADLPEVVGIVFLGFPLHAPNKPGDKRATHLFDVNVPMLFLQGTRDSLADLSLLAPICKKLGAKATLHIVEGGDHSFKVPKRSGRTHDETLDELADAIANWIDRLS